MKFTTEAKVGGVVLIAILVLFYMTFKVGSFRFLRPAEGVTAVAEFATVAGLDPKSAVKVAGVEVGKVEGITLADGRARVVMRFKKGFRLHRDAEAAIKATSLLGEKYIDLTLGTVTEPLLPDGGRLAKGTGPAEIDELVRSLTSVAEDVKTITASFRTVMGEKGGEDLQAIIRNVRSLSASLNDTITANRERLNRILANADQLTDTLNRQGREMVANLNSIVKGIEQGKGSLGKLIKDETLYTRANETLASLRQVAQQLEQGKGSLGKLIKDETLYTRANETLASLRQVARQLESGEGVLGKLLKDEALANDLKQTIANLNKISKQIESGQGTLGKLVKDDTLYVEAQKAIKKVGKAGEGITEITPVTTLSVILGTLF